MLADIFESQIHGQTALSSDVAIKLQLLSFTRQFLQSPNTSQESHEKVQDPTCRDKSLAESSHRQVPVSVVVPGFIKLCTLASETLSAEEMPKVRWADPTEQLILQAAIESYREDPDKFMSDIERSPAATTWQAKYIEYLQPPPGIAVYSQLEETAAKFTMPQLEAMIIEFLIDLMGQLKVPILMQLELGKLDGLSREDTLALKDRVGLSVIP